MSSPPPADAAAAAPGRLRRWLREIKDAIISIGRSWWQHDLSHSAAALAFYSLISLGPITALVVRVAAFLVGQNEAESGVRLVVSMVFDPESSDVLVEMVHSRRDQSLVDLPSIIGLFILLFTATRVLAELRKVLRHVFGSRVFTSRKHRVLSEVNDRIIPSILVAALGAALAFSVVAATAARIILQKFSIDLPDWIDDLSAIERIASTLVVSILFTATYRWLPPKPPPRRDAMLGGLFGGILMALLKGLVELYFKQSQIISGYGAAVALVIILLWIYFTVHVFFLGAELAAYLGKKRGGFPVSDPIEPASRS